MSEPCRENLPLLYDDYSDEDFRIRKSSPKFQRLFRHSAISGRARSQAIGAAAIITRWPEHFSSLLKYWWIGFGMIAFTFFVIYNSIVAISMLPETHYKPAKYNDKEYISKNVSHENSKINVFMHIFVNNYEESSIKFYLPHIVKFSKKYSNFMHNVIILLKDDPRDILENSDELNIKMAWNSLWMADKKQEIVNLSENTNIQIISLMEYMDESPLKTYWRRLPEKIYGFLTRCIAIWDKGGVAFDPVILTPSSPNPEHRESLEHILNNFKSGRHEKTKKENVSLPKKKINNIQDIINNIEYQDKNIMQENLLEEETRKDIFRKKNLSFNKIKRNTHNDSKKRYLNNTNKNKTKGFEDTTHINKIVSNSDVLSESSFNDLSTSKKVVNQVDDEVITQHNLFPMFLEYLFKSPRYTSKNSNKQISTLNDTSTPTTSTASTSLTSTNSALEDVAFKDQRSNSLIKCLSKRKMFTKKYINLDENSNENENNISLSINLKGNLIATETPCHAFIGTIFSNALQHYDDESITDFIITELLIFCKGVLSSCKGVDVILI